MPKPAGHPLGRRQRRPIPHRFHQPGEQRIAFDREAVEAHPDIGKDAVTRLRDEEDDDHKFANPAGSRAHGRSHINPGHPPTGAGYTRLLCASTRSPTLDKNSTL